MRGYATRQFRLLLIVLFGAAVVMAGSSFGQDTTGAPALAAEDRRDCFN